MKMEIERAVQRAEQSFRRGDLKGAGSACRAILEADPENGYALHMLGIVYYELEEYETAKGFLEKAVVADPSNADAYYDLGNTCLAMGDPGGAISYFRKAIEADPDYVDAYNNLGNALHDEGDIDEAISWYEKALEISPGAAHISNNLGMALQDKGRIDEAMAYYENAVRIKPDYADALYNLGNVYQYKEQPERAVPCYRRAIETVPDFAEAHYNLANAFKEQNMLDEALESYRRALSLNMDTPDLHLNIGYILDYQGKKDEALEAFGRALELDPDFFAARFAECMTQLPFIYMDQEAITDARRRYSEELLKLRDMISGEAFDSKSAADAVGSLQPFLLAYQGFNDRDLQGIYGGIVCKLMAAGYPEYSGRPPMPSVRPGEKIRVGIVSAYFYHHSNWKIPIKGWVENIDRSRFALCGYYTGKARDSETVAARRCFDSFVEDVYSLEDLCKIIRNDDLHILIYPEIGMDPLTVRLASLRLVPVQCTSWGHPETSGLPTMDYFLSSELMEPADGDSFYTERLIRLPNLSVHYKPLISSSVAADRSDFSLDKGAVLYLCCQSLFKYLPQYDEVFPRIAGQTVNCKFLFISNQRRDEITKQFRIRLGAAFERSGLSADDYVVFLPRLDPERYHAVNRMTDVYLDSIGWSGCNSTFEAIACGLPVVTFRGETMRGRHSSAILSMMGAEETVAGNLEEYVALAVRLGTDAGERAAAAERIYGRRHLAYEDAECIKGLEDFIERAVKDPVR